MIWALFSGRYGAYVGPAYALTAAVFLVLVVASLIHARRWKRRAGRDRK